MIQTSEAQQLPLMENIYFISSDPGLGVLPRSFYRTLKIEKRCKTEANLFLYYRLEA